MKTTLLLVGLIVLCTGLSAKDEGIREATVTAEGTAASDTGHRFETVTVVVYDDSGHPWKQLVLNKTDLLGKSTMGPVGSHFQCNILKSIIVVATGELDMLMVQIVDSKGRRKLIAFNVVEEVRQ
jgi:hypothetical protein